mmetsp:Transcript_58691/g.110720  ORF Transcript_58691/g.110720 Transcript_58691/m.110720 type:complete len:266 (+) Transcript_58691:724-1521(+)
MQTCSHSGGRFSTVALQNQGNADTASSPSFTPLPPRLRLLLPPPLPPLLLLLLVPWRWWWRALACGFVVMALYTRKSWNVRSSAAATARTEVRNSLAWWECGLASSRSQLPYTSSAQSATARHAWGRWGCHKARARESSAKQAVFVLWSQAERAGRLALTSARLRATTADKTEELGITMRLLPPPPPPSFPPPPPPPSPNEASKAEISARSPSTLCCAFRFLSFRRLRLLFLAPPSPPMRLSPDPALWLPEKPFWQRRSQKRPEA